MKDKYIYFFCMTVSGGCDSEKLFVEAESLMEMSNERQEKGDLPMALVHCDKAIGQWPNGFDFLESANMV